MSENYLRKSMTENSTISIVTPATSLLENIPKNKSNVKLQWKLEDSAVYTFTEFVRTHIVFNASNLELLPGTIEALSNVSRQSRLGMLRATMYELIEQYIPNVLSVRNVIKNSEEANGFEVILYLKVDTEVRVLREAHKKLTNAWVEKVDIRDMDLVNIQYDFVK